MKFRVNMCFYELALLLLKDYTYIILKLGQPNTYSLSGDKKARNKANNLSTY